jgi:two-component sensor histidine kinase
MTRTSSQKEARAMPDNRIDASLGQNHSEELNLLRARSAAYDSALRGSHVTVFTQDRALRYSVISGPIFNQPPDKVLGRDDEAVLPARNRATIVALKRDVLTSGEPRQAEVSVGEGPSMCWYDLHLEPLRDDGGGIVGVGGVSVDITERKEGEAHLRLLMRELTHRSKNLLAVIQAMGRQTARHAGSIDSFLEQFNARLQALAASHDLLVRESWYGASLRELVQSQIAPYFTGAGTQVEIEGPAVVLKPEAAQSVGLALHELAVNAAKFGALSAPGGAVSVTWKSPVPGRGVELVWNERDGPVVTPRRKRGFGTLVIEHNLVRALNAEVNWSFKPAGARCEMLIPAVQLLNSP